MALISRPYLRVLVDLLVVADGQSPGSDHEDGPGEGGDDLQEGGREVADQVGDSEHEERDGEEDAGPNSDEVRVS